MYFSFHKVAYEIEPFGSQSVYLPLAVAMRRGNAGAFSRYETAVGQQFCGLRQAFSLRHAPVYADHVGKRAVAFETADVLRAYFGHSAIVDGEYEEVFVCAAYLRRNYSVFGQSDIKKLAAVFRDCVCYGCAPSRGRKVENAEF